MKRAKLMPSKPGLLVPDIEHKNFLPDDGRVVNISTYWARRILCGDVLIVKDEPKKKVSKPKKKDTMYEQPQVNSEVK